ncbi:hypothetical protein NXS19_004728 [Fusarium pseudograminearum]|nr:hypothetical protein NXS19_004728 [Fusarium pseudograminearum]
MSARQVESPVPKMGQSTSDPLWMVAERNFDVKGIDANPCPWLPEDDGLPFFLWDRHARRTVETAILQSRPAYTAISHMWGRWRKVEQGQTKTTVRQLQTVSSLSVVTQLEPKNEDPTPRTKTRPQERGPDPRMKTRPNNEDPTQESRPPAPYQPLDTLFAALLLIQLACLPTLYSSSYGHGRLQRLLMF